VVAQDVEGGEEFLPGLPPLRPVAIEHLGGMLDTVTRKLAGPSECPVVWYVGERQASILLRRDPDRSRTLLYSSEGGGKTVLMSQWLILQVVWLLQAGEPGAIGATAPTHERLQTLVKAIGERIPIDGPKSRKAGAWATYYTEQREFRFASGHFIQCRSTKKQSEATGSPIQGFTWKASGDDELQDTAANGADPDIEMRLRGARTSYRMCTATAKDSPSWRTFRDAKQTSPNWSIERLSYLETPFIWPDHWQRAMQEMSPREWQRRGLALDVGPERMLYHTWDREKNLRPVPRIGAKDITSRVIGAAALVGHDPGKLFDVSLLLRCYEVQGRRLWWVEDEYTSESTTIDQHIAGFKAYLQDKHGLQYPDPTEPQVLVRCDPYSDSSDNAPDRGVYTAWKLAGFKALSAAYNKQGLGKGRVPKEARIEMVCRLLCNAGNERRLFVACDDRRAPVAPRLVESIELSERDEAGKAETQRKNKRDLSHWTAALGYALWSYERLRDVTGVRVVEGLG
jgi:hypothetical protein